MAGIIAYIGLPRHGKTHTAVMDQAVPALFSGRRVVTNVPLVEEELRAWCAEKGGTFGEIVQFTNDEMKENAAAVLEQCTAGSVVIIDELWRFLPRGTKAKDIPEAWRSLFAEFGHRIDEQGRMMQIVLITQTLDQLAASAYELVERTILVTKLTMVGSSTRFRVAVYQGAVKGLKPPIARRVSEQYSKYDQRVFKCYVSRTMSEADGDAVVDEKALDDRGTIWRNPYIRYVLPLAVIAGVWGVWQVVDFFTPEAKEKAEKEAVVGSVQDGPRGRSVRVDKGRVSAVIDRGDLSESLVVLERSGESLLVPMMAARCMATAVGGVTCQYEGVRYDSGYDFAGRARAVAAAGLARLRESVGVGADAVGTRE
jgi:zona occludens toxin